MICRTCLARSAGGGWLRFFQVGQRRRRKRSYAASMASRRRGELEARNDRAAVRFFRRPARTSDRSIEVAGECGLQFVRKRASLPLGSSDVGEGNRALRHRLGCFLSPVAQVEPQEHVQHALRFPAGDGRRLELACPDRNIS